MPDIHIPKLDEHDEAPASTTSGRRRSGAVKIVLEVVLISVGVFLGLLGEQWRENTQRREVAEASLRRFHTELAANRKAVAAVADYHATTLTHLQDYFDLDPTARKGHQVTVNALQPAFFEHTAWDLAVATKSLADIDPEIAFALSRAYGVQQEYMELTRGITQAMYLQPPGENWDPFLRAVVIYWGDITLIEPRLLAMYDELLPQLEHVTGK